MLDKKQIQATFLFGFRMGCKKQQRQPIVSTTHLAQELLMNVQCSCGSRSFAKETRALKMRSAVASHWKLTWPIERIVETDPLTATQEVAEELTVCHSTVIRHSKQIGKVEKLSKWVPHELTKNFKNRRFEVLSSPILYNNNEPFLHQIMACDEKWILFNNQQ